MTAGVALRCDTVARGTTFAVRDTVVVVRGATVLVLRASVDAVDARSRVFVLLREVAEFFVVVGVPRDWVDEAVLCAVERDAARATSSISKAFAL